MYIRSMRILTEIPDQQLTDLADICSTRNLSRAEAIRQAVDAYIERNRPAREAAFGLWQNAHNKLPKDGLKYQERLRSEW
jgi:metal-responsive CopG/Arc/MetJ family transcriptional regulator